MNVGFVFQVRLPGRPHGVYLVASSTKSELNRPKATAIVSKLVVAVAKLVTAGLPVRFPESHFALAAPLLQFMPDARFTLDTELLERLGALGYRLDPFEQGMNLSAAKSVRLYGTTGVPLLQVLIQRAGELRLFEPGGEITDLRWESLNPIPRMAQTGGRASFFSTFGGRNHGSRR